MPDTTFIDDVTLTEADWAQSINDLKYNVFLGASTGQQACAAINALYQPAINLPLRAINGSDGVNLRLDEDTKTFRLERVLNNEVVSTPFILDYVNKTGTASCWNSLSCGGGTYDTYYLATTFTRDEGDGTLQLAVWDTADNYNLVYFLDSYTGYTVNCAEFYQDEYLLVVGRDDGTPSVPLIKAFATETWDEVTINLDSLPSAGAATWIAVSPISNLVAIGTNASPYLLVYDTTDPLNWVLEPQVNTIPTGAVNKLAFNSDNANRLLAVAHNASPGCSIYDVDNWTKLSNPSTIPSTTACVSVDFSGDNTRLVTGTFAAPRGRVYNTSTWALVGDLSSIVSSGVLGIRKGPGSQVVLGDVIFGSFVVDVSTISLVDSQSSNSSVYDVFYSPDQSDPVNPPFLCLTGEMSNRLEVYADFDDNITNSTVGNLSDNYAGISISVSPLMTVSA